MRGVLFAIVFGLLGSPVGAQERKGIRFWNLDPPLAAGQRTGRSFRAADELSDREFLGRSQLRSGCKLPRCLGSVRGDRIH